VLGTEGGGDAGKLGRFRLYELWANSCLLARALARDNLLIGRLASGGATMLWLNSGAAWELEFVATVAAGARHLCWCVGTSFWARPLRVKPVEP
jgi:hypothetical protein